MSSEQDKPSEEYKEATEKLGRLMLELDQKKKPGDSAPDHDVRRPTRQGSKAQWYCAAEEGDERVEKFAAAVRKARSAKGWNQTQAADACGMSQPQWSNLESCAIEPLPRKVYELERVLGFDPGGLSVHLGYSPHGGDDRELMTTVAEKLDGLLVHGAWAVEEVLVRNTNPIEVQKFLEDAERIGLDVIAALAKVSNDLIETLNLAVDHAMPQVFRMKQAEMKNLRRIISVQETQPYLGDDEEPF
jgi:ribosome-binding protein aMBF1 (putative translation factor)